MVDKKGEEYKKGNVKSVKIHINAELSKVRPILR